MGTPTRVGGPSAKPVKSIMPAHALRHQIIAGALGIRPILAEAGDRAINQPRIFRREALVVEAELGEPADLEILQQDVGTRGELAHDAAAFVAFKIQLDRPLAAVGRMKIGRADMAAVLAVDKGRAPAAGVVAGALAFHLVTPAPRSASICPAQGPARIRASSRTRTPAKGRGISHS